MKKIGGNWHRVKTWENYVIGQISGGIVITDTHNREDFIPFYDLADYCIERNVLYLKNHAGQIYLNDLKKIDISIDPQIQESDYYPVLNSIKWEMPNSDNLIEIPRSVAKDGQLVAVAYKQKGIDFFDVDALTKINHFDFPGYSFIDDICIQNNKLYVADAFGLRILDIGDLDDIKLDDRFTVYKGWAKDIALYEHYVIVADVLGIKIYDRSSDFKLVGKIESNRNRIAKVVIDGHYAFCSCEAVGLKIADLSDIANPKFISGLVLPKGVWDSAVYKNHVYLAVYTQGILKVDISSIKQLKQIAAFNDGREIIGVSVNEKGVFCACSHDGLQVFDHDLNPISSVRNLKGRCWMVIENDNKLYAAAGTDGVLIYDVSELNKPQLITRIPSKESRDLMIRDKTLYIADGQNGVLVYYIQDISRIQLRRHIPSSAFTRGVMVDEHFIYKGDGDGGFETYEGQQL